MPTLKCFYCRLFLASPPPKTYPEAVNLTVDNSLPYILTGGFRPVSSIPELAKKITFTRYRIVLYPESNRTRILSDGIDKHSVTHLFVDEVTLYFLTCLYNKIFCLNCSKHSRLEWSRQQLFAYTTLICYLYKMKIEKPSIKRKTTDVRQSITSKWFILKKNYLVHFSWHQISLFY